MIKKQRVSLWFSLEICQTHWSHDFTQTRRCLCQRTCDLNRQWMQVEWFLTQFWSFLSNFDLFRVEEFYTILPRQPYRPEGNQGEVRLEFEAVLLDAQRDRANQLWIHARIKACVIASDCVPVSHHQSLPRAHTHLHACSNQCHKQDTWEVIHGWLLCRNNKFTCCCLHWFRSRWGACSWLGQGCHFLFASD